MKGNGIVRTEGLLLGYGRKRKVSFAVARYGRGAMIGGIYKWGKRGMGEKR
jgi:hypothetical protein